VFSKLLIANRGEIAVRVITTAKRLGIRTVAVFSDADAAANHVRLADEAVHIGASAATDSYLNADRIIQAARATGAEAIHPGYGFLSENAEFVDAVEAAGIIFVGPPASAIRAMGLKDAAKSLMTKAGVPVVPGYHGSKQDPAFLAAQADAIGYPVLIKARAGGGGKGMRRVDTPDAFAEALAGAQREGLASFGDAGCLVEKYIAAPRHIEVQVFGDAHGNIVHLFERDCSLQRRHQKVIEEAPAPGMPEDVRAAICKAAVEAARAVHYRGAGTVEFIADGSSGLRVDGFWFMEMNTRLQVEHPVTEAITGLDLVELQLRVAAGEALPFQQQDLRITGHAFEARVYAEDVPRGFLPAVGRLDHVAFPEGSAFGQGPVRIDSGVGSGDEISPWYDPMIAKLIVHGPTRTAALNMLTAALADCHIAGPETNLAFLGALSTHPEFRHGQFDTGLIARDLTRLVDDAPPPTDVIAVAALAALGLLNTTNDLSGFRQWSQAESYANLLYKGTRLERHMTKISRGGYRVDGEGITTELTVTAMGDTRYALRQGAVSSQVNLVVHNDSVTVFSEGQIFRFTIPDALDSGSQIEAGGDAVMALMHGLVRSISASPGQTITRGMALVMLEAMKMEHVLKAPRDGVIAEIMMAVGDQVAEGSLLLTLVPEAESKNG
jgi:3-methylcrotonyl-CoA carboxylase alpha subunit